MIDLPLSTTKELEYEAYNSGGVEKEVGELLYGFARVLKPHHILDLGTHLGISAAYLARACLKNGFGLVDTVEYDSQHWDNARKLWDKAGVSEYIFQYKCNIDDFENPSIMYDLILIDSEPPRRFAELDRFYVQLNPGGYLFVHDLPYGWCQGNVNMDHPEYKSWPYGDVPERLEQLLREDKLRATSFPNPRGMGLFYKVKAEDYSLQNIKD